MFNWLVTGQVAPMNPAARRPWANACVKTGKTPVLDGKEWNKLLRSRSERLAPSVSRDLTEASRFPNWSLFESLCDRHQEAGHADRK